MQNLFYQIIKIVIKGYHMGMGIYNITDNSIESRRGVFTVILSVHKVSDRQETSSTSTFHERELTSPSLVSFHQQIVPPDLKAPLLANTGYRSLDAHVIGFEAFSQRQYPPNSKRLDRRAPEGDPYKELKHVVGPNCPAFSIEYLAGSPVLKTRKRDIAEFPTYGALVLIYCTPCESAGMLKDLAKPFLS